MQEIIVPVAAITSVATMQDATRGCSHREIAPPDFCPNYGEVHCCEDAERNVRLYTQGKITEEKLLELSTDLDSTCEIASAHQDFLLKNNENLPLDGDGRTAIQNMMHALNLSFTECGIFWPSR